MGKDENIAGFVYAPGKDEDLSGTIFRYDFSVSQDGKTWEKVITDGEFSNIMHNPVPFVVEFRESVNARYFMLTPVLEISGDQKTSIGEIGIISRESI